MAQLPYLMCRTIKLTGKVNWLGADIVVYDYMVALDPSVNERRIRPGSIVTVVGELSVKFVPTANELYKGRPLPQAEGNTIPRPLYFLKHFRLLAATDGPPVQGRAHTKIP